MNHLYQQRPPQIDGLPKAVKEFAWESVEPGAEVPRQKTMHRDARASSPSSQSSPRCYAEPVPQPAPQTMDFMGSSSNGPYYELPYTSRASSTLPSPSPMTPTTEDMFHQWAGRRRPSDFAPSAAPSAFSPQSPRDYDLSSGNNLSSYLDGSYRPSIRANLFSEGFDPLPAASYPPQGQLTLDLKSDIAMNGPPYPTHIIDPQGDGISQAFLDPHVLNTVPDGSFPLHVDANLLSMNYGEDDFQTPPPDVIFQGDQGPPQVDEYVDAHNHAGAPQSQDQTHQTQETHRHTKNSTAPKTPTTHQAGQHRKSTNQQQLPTGRSSHQIRATSRAHNPCPICHKPFESSTKLRKHTRKEHVRPYPCIFAQYGCNSVFGTKNEWSRHVKVQHLRLETWRCNIEDCEKSVRDDDSPLLPPASKGKSEYDRKDLFLNHVRRCHKDCYPGPGIVEGPAAANYEEQAQQLCHLTLRSSPPESLCPCCPGVVWPDFDARLEHIGRAMESNEEARAGFQDDLLERYMLQEQLLCREAGRWLLTGADGKKGGRQAKRPAQKSLTTQTPLSSSSVGRHEPSVQPSRKSKRVALKRQQLSRQVKQEEENSEDDAEAEPDEDYAI